MVLWEITLGTAYFLGLRRTYRLALKIQRRLVGPKHPKIRHFLNRRTRSLFDVALRVHRKIQERDIEAGRNLGNWTLRWLDRMKPSAQIRAGKPPDASGGANMAKQITNFSNQKTDPSVHRRSPEQESDRHYFTSPTHIRLKPFSTLMAMRSPRPIFRRGCFRGVIRNDIMQWMLQR